ncbi:MAG: hypothetical protein ACE5G8_09535, partial [Anaerolineae bacterium]
MATDYPDVIGEFVVAPQRYEVDGLQYAGHFEPPAINQGERAALRLYLQNTLNVPLKIQLKPNVPQTGRFRAQPILSLGSSLIEVEISEAEAGLLTIPVTTTDQVSPGTHQLGLEFKVQHSRNATRIRKPRPKDPLQALPLDNVMGLNLVGVIGATYTVQNGKKSRFSLTISGEVGDTPDTQSLKHTYQKLWGIETGDSQHKAQIQVNESRARILDDLQVEPLFVTLYAENVRRFVDAGLPLRIGEAIALGKLLTYTAHLFLSVSELQDGLLCPIWERAIFNEYPTTNTLQVIKDVGYKHVLRLSAALSFGLIAQARNEQPWSVEERAGVVDYLADALEEGNSLDVDFLYLPLMMGALNIINQVRLPEEDPYQTLQLIMKARH